jgi:hypothetical protein
MSSFRKTIIDDGALRTFFQGFLGATTFGAYNQFVVVEPLKQNGIEQKRIIDEQRQREIEQRHREIEQKQSGIEQKRIIDEQKQFIEDQKKRSEEQHIIIQNQQQLIEKMNNKLNARWW